MTITKLRQLLQRLENTGMGSRIVRCPLHTATEAIEPGGTLPFRPIVDLRITRANPTGLYLIAEGEPEWADIGATSMVEALKPKPRRTTRKAGR